jgi:hypothetical protein
MTIKVNYFAFYAKAEATRMLLFKAGVDFENVNHTPETF